jgi:hypothetical protein
MLSNLLKPTECPAPSRLQALFGSGFAGSGSGGLTALSNCGQQPRHKTFTDHGQAERGSGAAGYMLLGEKGGGLGRTRICDLYRVKVAL